MKKLIFRLLLLTLVCCPAILAAAATDSTMLALVKTEPLYVNTSQEQLISLHTQSYSPKNTSIYVSVLAFLIAGSFIVSGLFIQKQQKHICHCTTLASKLDELQTQLEQVHLKEKELQRALEIKNQELASCSMNLLQKNEMIEELRVNLDKLKKTPAEQLPQQISNMRRLVDNSLHIDKDWEEFKLHFAQVHPALFRNLKDRFPELSNNDLKLCALIKLNLNLKEAASVLGIAPESVKSARYRLRKKFNLLHEENLVDFVQQMDEESQQNMLSA